MKKNIEKFDTRAIDIVSNGSIYKFNYKIEKDTDKKHIGFIIGKKYKTPEDIIALGGQGIDQYAMCSILWKAVQELTQEIEKLKEEKNEKD